MKSYAHHLLSTFLKAFLSLVVLTSTLAFGRDTKRVERFETQINETVKSNPSFKRAMAMGALGKAQIAPKMMGHYGQTIFLIWIIAGIETYRQKTKTQPLSAEQFDLKLLGEIFDMLINDVGLVSGMAGGVAANHVLKKPLEELQALIKNNVSRNFFKQLLTSGAVSFVTFIGWEAGSQLWEEALLQLDDGKFEQGKKLRFFNVLKSIGTLQFKDQDLKLFFSVMWQAAQIMTFLKPDQTRDWIYNTWRHRLATGEFITLVTGMVAGGTLGGSVVPGAGNVAGFFLGLTGGIIGGVATLLIPEHWKHAVTKDIREKRVKHNRKWLTYYQKQIWNLGYRFKNPVENDPITEERRLAELNRLLDSRRQSRNGAYTAIFEEVYHWKVKMQEAEVLVGLLNSEYVQSRKKAFDQEIQKQKNLVDTELKKGTRLFEIDAMVGQADPTTLEGERDKYLQQLRNLQLEAEWVLDHGPKFIHDAYITAFEMVQAESEAFTEILSDKTISFPVEGVEALVFEYGRMALIEETLQLMALGTIKGQFHFSYTLEGDEALSNEESTHKALNIAYSRGFDEAWFY